jgi:hypothetical protein
MSPLHYLRDDQIIESLQLTSKLVRSVCFDTTASIIALRVVTGSQFHINQRLTGLKQQIRSAGFRPKHYSANGESYLIIFLSQQISVHEAAVAIANWCSAKGFPLNTDGLSLCLGSEQFPIPLQADFAWLNEEGKEVLKRAEISFDGAVALFLSDLEKTCVTPQEFLQLIRSDLNPGAPVSEEIEEATAQQREPQIVIRELPPRVPCGNPRSVQDRMTLLSSQPRQTRQHFMHLPRVRVREPSIFESGKQRTILPFARASPQQLLMRNRNLAQIVFQATQRTSPIEKYWYELDRPADEVKEVAS